MTVDNHKRPAASPNPILVRETRADPHRGVG